MIHKFNSRVQLLFCPQNWTKILTVKFDSSFHKFCLCLWTMRLWFWENGLDVLASYAFSAWELVVEFLSSMNEQKIYCTSPVLEVDDEDRQVSPMFPLCFFCAVWNFYKMLRWCMIHNELMVHFFQMDKRNVQQNHNPLTCCIEDSHDNPTSCSRGPWMRYLVNLIF